MSPEDAPIGTIIKIGHPANGTLAQKDELGDWRVLRPTGRVVDSDDMAKLNKELIFQPEPLF